MAQNDNQRLQTPPPGVADSAPPAPAVENGTDLDAPTDLNLQASAPQADGMDAPQDATMVDHSTAERVASHMASSSAQADSAQETLLDKQHVSAIASDPDSHTVVMRASDTGSKNAKTHPTAPIAPSKGASDDNDELVGKEMGPARLERKLGQGGMGMVYLAHHMSLDKKVAVKILPRSLAERSPEYIERFRREAIAAGKLEHQNIVQVYDVNQAGDYYYIIMQYVEGRDLRNIVKKNGKLPLEKALDYTLQIARGLSAAHKEGIIHRDIKPENVLVNKENVAKIADFGLAGLQDSELTREGQAMGSPYYMSPEQCTGSALDIRTDIYALGVTLYFLLTGTHPFTGQTPVEIMHKHSSADIPNVSKMVSDVPESAALVIRRMLMKNRDDRYTDPDELVADLEALLHDPNAIPAGAMKARPPLVSMQAIGVLAAALVIVALIYVFGSGDKTGQGNVVIASTPTISISGVAIPVSKGKGVVSDPWRSPMRIAMFTLDAATDSKFITIQKQQIIAGLRKDGVIPVERDNFDKILAELAISQTDLVDKDKTVAVGKLLNAHLMLKLNVATEDKDGMVAAECVDVATSQILDSMSVLFTAADDKGRIPQATIDEVVKGVDALLAKDPIKGSVASVKENKAILDIGLVHGVKVGQVYAVVEQAKNTERTFTIESVEDITAVAVEKTPGKIISGLHLRQVQ